jgi:hypothetical protein
MALPDWTVIVGIVGAGVTSVVSLLRVRPEAKKFRADGAAALTTSAGAFVASVEHEMQALRAELASEKEARRAGERENQQWRRGLEIRLRRHSRWDEARVAEARASGASIPDPPPLFDDEDVVA